MPLNSKNTNQESEFQALNSHPIRFYALKHKRPFILGITMLLATNAVDVLPPLLLGHIINLVVEEAPHSDIYMSVGLFLFVSILIATFRYGWRVNWGFYNNMVTHDLRQKIFNKFTQLSQRFYQKNPVGELMSLINYDVTTFRMAVGPGTLVLLDATFMLAMTIPLMIYLSPGLSWKVLFFMPVVPFIISKLESLVFVRNKTQRDKYSEMSGFIQESLSGVRVIKSYAQEKNQLRRFKVFNKSYEDSCNDAAKVESLFGPVLELAATSGAVILIVLGAHEVLSNRLKIGDFFTYYQYVQKVVWPMTALGLGLTFIQKGRASLQKILELLAEKLEIKDSGKSELSHFETLEVRNLSFSYPDTSDSVLKDISFQLKAGESLGILGATGSGKSTLADLLCRVRPSKGVFINGLPIEEYQIKSLRSLISYVPQETFLFSQSVADNISMNPGSSFENIEKAAKIVNMDQEIEDMSNGYDSSLGERGINLSGGQRQRLAIARALHRNTALTIFDDTLSAVDSKTEEHILNQLKTHVKNGNSSIIISHRLASLKLADKILVLNSGGLEAYGSHEDVLNSSPTYKRIHSLQSEGALSV